MLLFEVELRSIVKPNHSCRRFFLEQLEARHLCASDWQNAVNPLDVDGSGVVQPLDALVVINDLNAFGSRQLPARSENLSAPLSDTNGDGFISPIDALLVINDLNRVRVGSVAPAVKLQNQAGEMIDVSALEGEHAVVLYFYPKDDTPGCTVEALDFSARKTQIESLGAKIYGVSLDPVDSKKDFADKHQLSFDILADPDKKVTLAYGVLTQINNMPIAERTTFIIGKDGTIKHIFDNVQVASHGAEVVALLESGIAN